MMEDLLEGISGIPRFVGEQVAGVCVLASGARTHVGPFVTAPERAASLATRVHRPQVFALGRYGAARPSCGPLVTAPGYTPRGPGFDYQRYHVGPEWGLVHRLLSP
jgi:hypothetical protein